MRLRLLVALSVVGLALVVGVVVVALADSGRRTARPGLVEVAVGDLGRGDIRTVDVVLPDDGHRREKVFVVRADGGQVHAFLDRSTHLGCRLVDDPGRQLGAMSVPVGVAFADPCGGSLYSLDGSCIGGPCPRALDTYAVEVRGDTATVDLLRPHESSGRTQDAF